MSDMWDIDPLPVPDAAMGTMDYWRWCSRMALAARRANPDTGCFPDGDLDPAPDADEWDDCPEDDSYTYTDDDARRFAEDEMDAREGRFR